MEALALKPTEPYYHKLLSGIDRKIKERPKLYYDFFKGHDENVIKEAMDSNADIKRIVDADVGSVEDPQKLVSLLHEAQFSKHPELLFDRIVPLLKHPSRNVRREATEFFLMRGTKRALQTFLTTYTLATDTDLKWRLLYMVSEKFPEEAVREAKWILNSWENVNRMSQQPPELTILEALSLRILAHHSPKDLALFLGSESWKPYEKIEALYITE